MTHRFFGVAIAITCVALWAVLAGLFDQDLLTGEQRHYADPEVQQLRQTVAIKMCGPDSNPMWLDGKTLRCRQHNHKKGP